MKKIIRIDSQVKKNLLQKELYIYFLSKKLYFKTQSHGNDLWIRWPIWSVTLIEISVFNMFFFLITC